MIYFRFIRGCCSNLSTPISCGCVSLALGHNISSMCIVWTSSVANEWFLGEWLQQYSRLHQTKTFPVNKGIIYRNSTYYI
jgi:hypothetical protein